MLSRMTTIPLQHSISLLTRVYADALCARSLHPAREVLREHDLHELRVGVLRPLQILDSTPRVEVKTYYDL